MIFLQAILIAFFLDAALVMAQGDSVPDATNVNLVFNLISLVILVGGVLAAPRYLKSKKIEGQLREKDDVISTHEQSLAALKERTATQEMQINSIKERATQLEQRALKYQQIAERFQGRHEEQSKYTAKEALGTIQGLLQHQEKEAARRHTEIITVLEKMVPNQPEG